MSENIERIKLANNKYSEEFGNKSDLEIPPVRRLAVLTCMDARLEPMKFLGSEVTRDNSPNAMFVLMKSKLETKIGQKKG